MAHAKRPKSHHKGTQKQATAKQAAQKKLKDRRATKFRNEELRTMLDNETSTVYSINKDPRPEPTKPPPMHLNHEFVQDITTMLGKL